MITLCAVPDCRIQISERSLTGVCREHTHRKGYCACRQCRKGKSELRLKTREELIEEGLLLKDGLFDGVTFPESDDEVQA